MGNCGGLLVKRCHDNKFTILNTTAMKKNEKEVTLVYAGIRLSTKGKKIYTYYDPSDPKDLIIFKKLLMGIGAIGATFTGTEVDGQTYRGLKMSPSMNNADAPWRDLITGWSAKSRAILEGQKMEREMAKPHSDSVEELVGRLKDETWQMNRVQQRAFAVWVYSELLKGS